MDTDPSAERLTGAAGTGEETPESQPGAAAVPEKRWRRSPSIVSALRSVDESLAARAEAPDDEPPISDPFVTGWDEPSGSAVVASAPAASRDATTVGGAETSDGALARGARSGTLDASEAIEDEASLEESALARGARSGTLDASEAIEDEASLEEMTAGPATGEVEFLDPVELSCEDPSGPPTAPAQPAMPPDEAELAAQLREHPENTGLRRQLRFEYERRGDWDKLAALLLETAELVDSDECLACLTELAGIYEHRLADLESAFMVLQVAFRRDVEAEEIRGELERLAHALGRWDELAASYDEAAQRLEEAGRQRRARDLWLAMAGVAVDRLGDHELAQYALLCTLQLDERNLDALALLAQVQSARGDWAGYIETTRRRERLERDERVIAELRAALGLAYEQCQGLAEEAAQAYCSALELDPGRVEALAGLERLWQQRPPWDAFLQARAGAFAAQGDWHGLAAQLRAWLDLVQAPAPRAALQALLAALSGEQLLDLAAAQEAYEELVALEPANADALAALAEVYAERGAWEAAAAALTRLHALEGRTVSPAELRCQLGLRALVAGDPVQAERFLLEAVASDPACQSAVRSLADLYESQQNWHAAAVHLEQALALEPPRGEAAELAFRLGVLHQDGIGDEATASDWFARALALEPGHFEAGWRFARFAYAEKRWAELEPVLAMLLGKAEAASVPADEHAELHLWAARTAIALGKPERAASAYAAALALEPGQLGTLLEYAALLLKREEWAAARDLFSEALDRARQGGAGPETIAEIAGSLGWTLLKLGHARAAAREFEQALRCVPQHVESLRGLGDIALTGRNFPVAVRFKAQLAELLPDGAERRQLLLEIAELRIDKLKDHAGAVRDCEALLRGDPDDRRALHKLVSCYAAVGQWKHAVAATLRLASLERSGRHRGTFHQAAGVMCRDRLGNPRLAVEQFEAALDAYFSEPVAEEDLATCLKPFGHIERILTEQRDWKALERHYRATIKRVPEHSAAARKLWLGLGELNRTRLRCQEGAILAYEVAAKLDPSKTKFAVLAELYGPQVADKSSEQWHKLIVTQPSNPEHYRGLFRVYLQSRQYDKAWNLAAALVLLGKASSDERKFYDSRRPQTFLQPTQPVTELVWDCLRHPDEDRNLSQIFAALALAVSRACATSARQLGIHPGRVEPELGAAQQAFGATFAYLGPIVGVPSPQVHVQPSLRGELTLVSLQHRGKVEPAFIVTGTLLMHSHSAAELSYVAGRGLASLYSPYFVCGLLPTTRALDVVLDAALCLVRRKRQPEPRESTQLRELSRLCLREFRHLRRREQQALATALQRLGRPPQMSVLECWRESVRQSCRRLGLLLCGDVCAAASRLRAEPPEAGSTSYQDRLRDLLVYSVSEKYFTARRLLGLQRD